jgi:hypothetical protein
MFAKLLNKYFYVIFSKSIFTQCTEILDVCIIICHIPDNLSWHVLIFPPYKHFEVSAKNDTIPGYIPTIM